VPISQRIPRKRCLNLMYDFPNDLSLVNIPHEDKEVPVAVNPVYIKLTILVVTIEGCKLTMSTMDCKLTIHW